MYMIEELLKYNVVQSDESKEAVRQYNPETHKVMQRQFRKDKTIYVPVLNSSGDPELDHNGNEIFRSEVVPVNRVSVSLQKTIVRLRKHFMNLKNAVLYSDDDDSLLLSEINKVRSDNKYSFKIEEIAERTMSELLSAEMWWLDNDGNIKMKVISPEKGDVLLPVFDDHGDMVAFLRKYKVKDEELLDVFTSTENYTFNSKNEIVDTWKNAWNKIPIIYYSQEKPEWSNVQTMIERYETLLSNFADSVDYTGNPILLAKGHVQGFAKKSDSGKVFQLDENASMEYLIADGAPEAVSLELKTLRELIHTLSHTPQISIQSLSGAGTSGTAFDRLFIDAQLSADGKLSGTFGESMQRSVNLVSAMLRSIKRNLPNDAVEVEVEAFRFDDTSDFIKNMVLLKGTLSSETITKMTANRFGYDGSEEWSRLEKEKDIATIEDFS